MNAEALAGLLGLRSTDARVESVLQDFGVRRRPALELDAADADGPVVKAQDWVSNLSAGIEFGFEEEGSFMGLAAAERGVGPMVLTEVYFYGQRPGVKPCREPLPFGLRLDDDRATVRGKMVALERTRRSFVRDTWDHPAFRVTVSYAEQDARIDFIVCMLRPEPPEPFEEGIAAMPPLESLLALLGKPLDDKGLRGVFVPLGLDRLTLTTGLENAIDFRRTYGFRLGFRPGAAGRTRPLQLHDIEFMRAGELESRGWRGELPFGLRFDDSPETVFSKIGLAPDHREEQEFSGQAFWRMSDFSLLVVYSTIENMVLRASVIAPDQ